MDIFITMNDFPTKLLPLLKEELKRQGIKADVQERPNKTVVFSYTSQDVVKVQIFTILLDKYRFMEGGDEDGEEKEAPL